MDFCDNCENMLYYDIKESGESENKLEYKCMNCNFTKKYDSNKGGCILKINYNMDDIKKSSILNPYIYDDITLPKAEGIRCPNKSCPTATKNPDIVYIQYDKKNMKYLYICMDCYRSGNKNHIW